MSNLLGATQFREQVYQALVERLGLGWERYSNAQILALTGLQISEKTLRKIRTGGYTPTTKTQAKILRDLQSTSLESAMLYTGSSAARDEVRALLGFGLAELPLGNSDPRLPCDLVIEDTGLGLSSNIVRCLDDFVGQIVVPPRYFSEVIENLSAVIQKFSSSQGVIISHRRPPQQSVEQALRARINLRQYDDFIHSRLSKTAIRAWLAQARSNRSLSDEEFVSLQATTVKKGRPERVDALDALMNHLSKTPGSAMATILGSFGTGKTSTMLMLANRLAQQDQPGRDWMLPLWIEASNLGADVSDALHAAIVKLSPDNPLPLESVKKLISRGKLWLFIDALDEALALSNVDHIKRFIEDYAKLLPPHGRLVVTARQEMFNSNAEEIEVFESSPREAHIDRTIILRMNSMDREDALSVIRTRLNSRTAVAQVVTRVESDSVLSDLITRPIFMHIATAQSPKEAADAFRTKGVATLFENYVTQWSHREQHFVRETRMLAEDRLRACELLALSHMVFGGQRNGFSVEDLKNFAQSDLTVGLEIKNIDLFVYEARIAMFLERSDDNRFDFSHKSMREFFLARRAARELRETAGRAAARDRAMLPYFFRTLGRVPLRRDMILARTFTIELCAPTRSEQKRIIEPILDAAREWTGHSDPEALQQEEVTESPPFGPGRYRYLIPNLVALLQRLQDPERNETVNLDGAYLPLTDLGECFEPTLSCRVSLRRANLAFSKVPRTSEFSHVEFITDGALTASEDAAQFCVQNGLLEKSRFNDHISNEFVLIPGGDQNMPPQARVGPYLIQRYPVTNRQFMKFLIAHEEWRPEVVRRNTQNDYYLQYWPLNPRSEVLSNPEWLDRPVVQVSWRAAAAFAAASGMRLPTELEWETAARRGQKNPADLRPWGNELSFDGKIAAIFPSEKERADPTIGRPVPTASVLKERENVPGFMSWKMKLGDVDVPSHMIGLVREWVFDIWGESFPSQSRTSHYDDPVCLVAQKWTLGTPAPKPTGDLTVHRVLRGGGYNSPDEHLSVQYRAPHRSLNVNPDVGFRCVRPIRIASLHK